MFASRHGRQRRPAGLHQAYSPSPPPQRPRQFSARVHATADFTEADDDEEDDDEDDFDHDPENPGGAQEDDEDDEDAIDDLPEPQQRGPGGLPVIPLFSSTHLDTLPVYNITHAIRIIVSTRTETSLSWEQLRSPQVSQFLVKPMQQQIRAQHFSRATIYALMANCLQFNKEGQRYAANTGISNTRSKVCELLALKLLKEYSTRELIDALAYDFYPLQGLPGAPEEIASRATGKAKGSLTASRTSTLEVAIRASAKHFLAHPVVIQQLEAIWNGAISFYSAADTLHREEPPSGLYSHANGSPNKADDRTPLLGNVAEARHAQYHVPSGRRTVMLYDPRQASIFKLSRLRVPRYRSFLSTLSLAVLIGLFLAVLIQRSVHISGLELVFWFWSAGFMLDELVGFNEQGFALYIMSFWNVFDLGILVLLIVYYCMRAYGVFLVDPHHWNDMAYDVLAANAILLLPRIFSVLDHYQYFSQLLIAFRLMTLDLAAVFILVLIMCSGFYVFFTLSNVQSDGGEVAYKIFQILMGFTPAVWDVWPTYNWLARGLMVVFLIICHYLVVTILITVLTNSFTAIASNATEEHQFVFAINTISMVKNDALFSYIAPTNIFAWVLMPLRYCMPLRQFVWLNRTIIKATHFPILFCIYLYERFWLAPSMFEPTDLVENNGRGRRRAISFGDAANRTALFSPNIRVREESVAGFQKDRALEELFRRAPASATLRTQRRNERRKTQNAIRNWMEQHDEDGNGTHWPTIDSRAVPEWQRRMSVGWERGSHLRRVSDMRSAASDPAEFLSNNGAFGAGLSSASRLPSFNVEFKDQTDADGDDELVTNDEDEEDTATNIGQGVGEDKTRLMARQADYFGPILGASVSKLASSHSSYGAVPSKAPATPRPSNQRRGLHSRALSTNTILFNPEEEASLATGTAVKSPPKPTQTKKPGSSGRNTTGEGHTSSGRRSPARKAAAITDTKARPIVVPAGMAEAGGVSRTALLSMDAARVRLGEGRRLSSVDLSVMSDQTGMGADDSHMNLSMPGSFQTQMAMAMMRESRMRVAHGIDAADRDRMGRLVLARMKTLEESFADVVKEMRYLKNTSTPPTRWNSSNEGGGGGPSEKRAKTSSTPSRGSNKRPVSRRSLREVKVSGQQEGWGKGKGKAVAYSSDEGGDDDGDEALSKRVG
ncbi:cation channel family transporter, putative [Cordyceps militaris CM01]|uniref:Cation channel family transporter, putative n=1 Tax=Cordyceps militaris (strain CM01) TaxID=983644 RepID=G3JE95_CORMM|nr:cation channel family transporter, putative [Cordyceps militaris CM01]EGX92920.1 cation channel family transporter, putative [Cordyceps militaris CM01]